MLVNQRRAAFLHRPVLPAVADFDEPVALDVVRKEIPVGSTPY
jgi:hypothetical protein